MKPVQFYVNGAWTVPLAGTPLDVINRSIEEICATISLGAEADTQAAVDAAREAFQSWSLSSKSDRLALMKQILAIHKKRYTEIAEAISQELGAPIDIATSSQASSCTIWHGGHERQSPLGRRTVWWLQAIGQ